MTIWKQSTDIHHINARHRGTIMEALDIRMTAIGDDWLSGTMPVDHRTRQPFGLLHGGASVVLAETLGSTASLLTLDVEKEVCVGLDINANHIRSVREGIVTGTAKAIHLGRTTQVWEIRIEEESGKLVCVSRLTMAVIPSPGLPGNLRS